MLRRPRGENSGKETVDTWMNGFDPEKPEVAGACIIRDKFEQTHQFQFFFIISNLVTVTLSRSPPPQAEKAATSSSQPHIPNSSARP